MILISMALVLVGAVTLVIGFFNESRPEFIYTTIAASLLAALFLLLGIVRQRPSSGRPALAAGSDGSAGGWGAGSWSSGGRVGTLERDDAAFGGVETTYERAPDPYEAVDDDDEGPVEDVQSADWWAPTPDEVPQTAETTHWDDSEQDDETGEHSSEVAWRDDNGQREFAAPRWDEMETGRWDPHEPEAPLEEPAAQEVSEPKLVVQAPEGTVVSAADRETERFLEALRPVRGVGPSKQSELLAHFKTLRRLRNASVDRIADVPGISTTLAQRIYNELHH